GPRCARGRGACPAGGGGRRSADRRSWARRPAAPGPSATARPWPRGSIGTRRRSCPAGSGAPSWRVTLCLRCSRTPEGTGAAVDVHQIAEDLRAEHDALDAVAAPLSPEQWEAPTPSPRWAVRDQIAHLTYFDRTAQ